MKIKENEIDKLIGNRLRTLRRASGMTQEYLGNELGVSFQQIQKYEKASNRIGAGKLHLICDILGISVNDFLMSIDELKNEPQLVDYKTNNKLDVKFFRYFLELQTEDKKILINLAERLMWCY